MFPVHKPFVQIKNPQELLDEIKSLFHDLSQKKYD